MKNILNNYLLYIVATMVVIQSSGCEKEIIKKLEYEAYQYQSTDLDAGTWVQTLSDNPDKYQVIVPADVTSAEYKAELDVLKISIENMTQSDRDLIAYWGINPIIRWNEIARELCAKYNLIPSPNEDGTYPSPDPLNPGKYPYFPFSHPPYSCRVYAYMSAAQFDGLISAWHYKKLYNRPAIYKTAPAIPQAFVNNDLPSYPADGAVISAVSRDILSVMFPLDKEYLSQKAMECNLALQKSGLQVPSDIVAGEKLGMEVAKVFLARASTDGMKKAQTPKPVSDSIKQAAFDRFGWKWENQESPKRPVGLTPLFGQVKTWYLTSLETVRPPVPPAIGSAEFNVAAEELKSYAKNLTVEQRRIANWWSDGFNTTTPPGHWNKLASELIVKYKMNPIRAARVYAYMNMAVMDAGISCWDAKYYYHYPRPIETITGFKTILGTPNFPSYTSGHSTFSAAGASILAYIFPNEKSMVDGFALEAAESRIYGGIHYRFDSEAGLEQGRKVAEYTILKASVDGAQ